jgi:hypothetical protein
VASRKEEKERLRREREEAERAAMASEGRRRRLGIVLGGLLAVAVVAVVAFAVLSGGDDDGGGGGGGGGDASLPAVKSTDLDEAVETAGCEVKEFPNEGNQHLPNQDATFDDYKTNPPTSGTHRPPPAAPDGIYEPGGSPDKENWVHTLEHGRVIFQYAPGTPQQRIDQLETLMNEEVNGQPSGFKSALMENNTEMPFAVAAVAWQEYVACKQFTNDTFDALRAFRAQALREPKAPEADFPWPAS